NTIPKGTVLLWHTVEGNYVKMVITTYGYTLSFNFEFLGQESTDLTPPDLDHPADITYIEGTNDNIITWTLGDKNPHVYNITRDGAIFVSDTSWINGSVSINVDGLTTGNYIFTITVFDRFGNLRQDDVLVSVIAIQTESTTIHTQTESTTIPTQTESIAIPASAPVLPINIIWMLLGIVVPVTILRSKQKI
ncbi:MAG: hypothetical protein IH840_15285, partial [Candidatus Heimdallarchaeota archaeon]|nr:hypothetical protein [Candidatus Heimdallarchaeota archaeon]